MTVNQDYFQSRLRPQPIFSSKEPARICIHVSVAQTNRASYTFSIIALRNQGIILRNQKQHHAQRYFPFRPHKQRLDARFPRPVPHSRNAKRHTPSSSLICKHRSHAMHPTIYSTPLTVSRHSTRPSRLRLLTRHHQAQRIRQIQRTRIPRRKLLNLRYQLPNAKRFTHHIVHSRR
jgi:hypothetical protein